MKKTRKTPYDAPLSKIFVDAGLDVAVILLISCVAVYLLMLYIGYDALQRGRLMIFCVIGSILCAYLPASISLFRTRKQERILGIRWKDRTDNRRPMQERDWYLSFDRGGFILYHRAYIKRILGSFEETITTDLGHENVRCVRFEDITGKLHVIRFSSGTARGHFLQWAQRKS